ncbi:MAG: chromosome segregation protein SMC [Clostridiales bacterium]|nr:chromosome segregation protein SMC [Candidatus Cacconaster stercorequi]
MYLKALEIQGFKSFPDKTVLNFGEDITAIVGPNGSGKSNISDAIRWVMGEQNSRQLRGAKMEDVIFGGTEKRGPMGFAQVTLVIDNTEHIFARDEAEVAVTRRYYRSGESEYYINKQSVRLKDVNELFMDTGLGREGYSIIGQGKIDEILSVKSGERREIFEEAAGISKFRHRKEDTERKMQRTEENLVRINDKIAELELQVEPLRQQAETAKKYLVLRDELRVLEISVWLENLQTLKSAALKLRTDYETAVADKENAQRALDAVYAEAEQCAQQVRDNDIAAEQVRTQVSGLESATGEQESAIAVLQTGVEHNQQSIARIRQEMADTENRTDNLQSQMNALQSRIEEIDRQSGEVSAQLEQLLESVRQASENVGSAAQELDAIRAKEALVAANAADLRAELSALTAGQSEVAERSNALINELTAAQEKLTQSQQESRENRKALDEARDEAQAVGNIIQGHSLKMEGRQRRADEAAAQKVQLTMDVGALKNRIHLLSEMEKEYEGFSKAVKIVMQASDRNALHGIHGPVANLMTTDEKYTVALEIALGAGMQNIVVDREEDGKNAIGYLKQRQGGRATFLPLNTIRGEELQDNRLADEYGFVGIASRLVQYDKQYTGVFRSLLGRTVVVEDLDCAIAMARRYQNRFRIVTLDGQIINRGGSMTGGSVSRNTGVLSRANELKNLQEKLGGMEQKLAESTQRAEETARELKKAQYELEVAREQQRKAEDDVLTLEGRQNHFNILLESLRTSCESMEAERKNIERRTAADRERMEQVTKSIAACERESEELHRQAQQHQAGQNNLMAQSNQLSEQITRQKAAQAALQAERETTLRSMDDLRAVQEDMKRSGAEREALAQQFLRDNEQAESEMQQRREKVQALRQQMEALHQKLNRLADEKMELEGRRNARERESRECNDALLSAEREVGRLDQKLAGNAMEEKNILDKLWERYELSHSDALQQRIELESVPKATRRIGELNRAIKSLGTPNIGAIEEFDRVNTRYTYLSEQRTDVEKAKDELQGIIDEITRQMTEIFAQQFKLLNESFQETFLELFGGGRAQLELEDEGDILNCGIEIKVQPPGKQLKTITLLSGGEKAFVAIALYFAILKVHPTPFCVMDEIEAALDEANVVRYARYMRRITGKTQFIVITHRRGTMEEADVLYGVTMQERGVSRMLTINLNDMAKELKIK